MDKDKTFQEKAEALIKLCEQQIKDLDKFTDVESIEKENINLVNISVEKDNSYSSNITNKATK